MKNKRWNKLISGFCAGAISFTMLPYSGMAVLAESCQTAVIEARRNASAEVTDTSDENIYTADADYMTRAEWIHTLVDAFEMGVDDESTMEEYFTDIAGNQYETDINLAANFGVFDIDSETFVPDDYVSREFMAHTMNYCLGFADDVEPTFTDAADVYYAGDAQVAVDRGWLTLVNGEFRPDAYVVQSEVDAALADMQQIFDETEMNDDEMGIVTDASVIAIEDTAEVTMSGSTVTITGSSATVSEGDTISFPVEGNTLVRKVTSCFTDEETGIMNLEVEMPEEDAVEEVSAAGYGYIDYDNIEVLSDDFELEIVDEEEAVSRQSLATGPYDIPIYGWGIGGNKDISTKSLQLKSKTFDVGGGKVTVSGGLDSLTVPYKLDMSGLTVKKLKVGVDAEASLTAKFVTEMSAASGEIQILKIPVYTAGVASIAVTVSISISVKGEVSITYSCGANGSVEYTKKNGWRFEKSFKSKGFTIEASVEEKIGVKLALKVTAVNKTLGEVYFSFGEKGKAVAVRHSDGFTCVDVSAYVYAEFGLKFALPKYSKTWTLIDASNSPFYLHHHYDNDIRVNACTYGQTDSSTSYIGSKTADGGTVSKNSRVVYSGASGNIKKASGSKSSKWTSSYSSYTQAFVELTPPAEINESTTLTEDTTYPYGLIINANLDLNGYKLTVKGDVTHNSGTVNFNKGTMTVSGDYTADGRSFPKLAMDYKEDTFVVEGTFSMGRDSGGELNAIAGTCEFKGDFYSYYQFNASDLHKTIFSGTKDQIIYCKDDYRTNEFNVVEIQNSDSKKLLLESLFVVQKAITCDGDNLSLIGSNTVSSDTAYIKIGSCAAKNLTIDSDCQLEYLNYTGENITINGNVSMTGTVDMNGSTWVNNGNLSMTNKPDNITVDGGNLTVNGDFTIGGYYSYSDGLVMNNKADVVTVTGDLLVKDCAQHEGGLTNGILYVGGDIYATESIYATENHQIVLTGKEDQNLYMPGTGSHLNYLKIENSGSRKFTLDGYFRANTIDCGEESLNLITNDIPGNVGSVSFGKLTCSDLNIEGDVNFYGNNTFKGKTINVNGSCTLQNWQNDLLDIGDATMTVKGDFTENESYYDEEYVKIAGGKLNVEGDYQQNQGVLHISSGTVSVAGDAAFNGSITMDKDDSLLTIAGDMDADYDSSNSLTAGSIELAGDYTDVGYYCMKSSGTFQFILTGEKDQTIKIDYYPTDNAIYHFSNLVVQNADTRKLILKNQIDIGQLTCDGAGVQVISSGGILNSVKLRCPLSITGDLITVGNTIDLNGYDMTVDGSLYQHSGTIQPTTGKLTVTKNYLIVTNEDSAVYGTSSGILNMTNTGDSVSVGGDFITNTTENHQKYLTAGLLEIKGDFHQMAAGTTFAFPASGTHQVLLSGDTVQNVTFDSYDDSHFNILALNQPESQYVFNENPCWNEMVSGSDVTTESTEKATTTTTTETTAISAEDVTTENTPETAKTTTVSTAESTTVESIPTEDMPTTKETDSTEDSTISEETTSTETTTQTTANEQPGEELDSVELVSGETLTEVVTIGKAIQLKLPEGVTAVSWTSTQPDVVTVGSDGVCKVLGEGDALIVASDSTGTVYMLQIQGISQTEEMDITWQMKDAAQFITRYYCSVDERPLDPREYFDYVYLNGEDVTDQLTLSWLGHETPREIYDAYGETYVANLCLDVTYNGQLLENCYGNCNVYIGVKGDTNLNGKVEQTDAFQTLMYCSHMSLGDYDYRLTDADDDGLELLDFFLSDVDGESLDADPGKMTQTDAYHILMMSSYVSLGKDIPWSELIPSLQNLEGSCWAA